MPAGLAARLDARSAIGPRAIVSIELRPIRPRLHSSPAIPSRSFRNSPVESPRMSSRTPETVGGARGAGHEPAVQSEVSVRCPLCDADHYRVRYDSTLVEPIDPQRHYTSTSREFGRFGRIVECRSCGIVYMNPRPHHLSVQDAYGDVEDVRYVEEEEGRVATFSESLDHMRRYAPSGRLLDVGCHVGTFISLAEEAGFDVAGVEPSRWAARRAEARVRGTVRLGVVEDAPLPEGAYDVVTMWDVIEHLPDPSSTLRARALGAPAGRGLRRHDDGRGGALPARGRAPLAVVHADAPRLLLAPHAR